MSQEDFIALIQQHQGIVNKILFLYGDGQEERKDLRQEILTEAWRAYPRFRGEAKFSTWLYRVGLNVAIGSLRRRKNTEYLSNHDSKSVTHSANGEGELLEQILRLLNPVEKSVVLLLLEGYGQKEIGDILGISPANTRVKIHRIREKLKAYGIDRFVE